MHYYLLFFFFQLEFGQETLVQNNIGLFKLNFEGDYQGIISITMVSQEKGLSILIVCDSPPNFRNISQIYLDDNFNCLSDWNAFDNNDFSQQLMIIFNQSKQFNSKINNIKYSIKKELFIGVFSSNYDSFSAIVQQKDADSCLKYGYCLYVSECKNGGECQNNICVCQNGFFRFDCGIQGVDILKEQYLEQNTIYYLDLDKQQKSTYSFQFQQQVLISYQCLSLNPYFQRQQILFVEKIDLTNGETLNCMHSQKQNLYSHYYIFQSQQKDLIYFSSNQSESQQDYRTILIAVLSSCITFICFVGICLIKCYRQRKIVIKNNTNITVINIQNPQKILDIQLDTVDQVPAIEFQKALKKKPKLYEQTECLICLDVLKKEQFVRVTYCHHVFHYKCFDAWMKKNLICPICRSPQDKKTLQKFYEQEKLISIIQTVSQHTEFNNNEISAQKPQKSRNYGEYPIMTNNRSTIGSSKLIQSNP